jgi:lipopolysaccharide assembly protein B
VIYFIDIDKIFNLNLLAIVLLVAIIIAALLVMARSKPKKPKKEGIIEYISALNYLLNGEKDKAFEKLKISIKYNTANIDAYIKIGDIFRDRGELVRAIRIHRSLIIRDGITTLQIIEIYKSLIRDYQMAKKFTQAIEICNKLSELTHHDRWVDEIYLKLLEEKGDWEEAFEIKKKLLRDQNISNDKLLALYKVQAGVSLISQQKGRDGRVKFREAMKLDKTCAPAYLYLSDSYISEKRTTNALRQLKRFVELTPNLAYLGFGRIKEILFQTGNFGDLEQIYANLLRTNPKIHSIRFALVDIFERKGELDKAIDLCHEELENDPNSVMAKRYLVKYYAKTHSRDKALNLALEVINNLLAEGRSFVCKECGFKSQNPLWRCPQCSKWDTFVD